MPVFGSVSKKLTRVSTAWLHNPATSWKSRHFSSSLPGALGAVVPVVKARLAENDAQPAELLMARTLAYSVVPFGSPVAESKSRPLGTRRVVDAVTGETLLGPTR